MPEEMQVDTIQHVDKTAGDEKGFAQRDGS